MQRKIDAIKTQIVSLGVRLPPLWHDLCRSRGILHSLISDIWFCSSAVWSERAPTPPAPRFRRTAVFVLADQSRNLDKILLSDAFFFFFFLLEARKGRNSLPKTPNCCVWLYKRISERALNCTTFTQSRREPLKDTALTKMAYVRSKMVDETETDFPEPPFWISRSCQSPDSHPAAPGALCSFPEQFTPLINCTLRSKKKKKRQRKQSEVCKHIKLGIRRSDWPIKWHTLCLLACVNVWVFLTVFEVLGCTVFTSQTCKSTRAKRRVTGNIWIIPSKNIQ